MKEKLLCVRANKGVKRIIMILHCDEILEFDDYYVLNKNNNLVTFFYKSDFSTKVEKYKEDETSEVYQIFME